MIQKILMAIASLAVLSACVVGANAMAKSKPELEQVTTEAPPPSVLVATAEQRPVTFRVRAQGTSQPKSETTLVAEVEGKITDLSPDLAPGGFFLEGQFLAAVDHREYELAVTQAKARVAEAQTRLATEEARARVAASEWKALGGKGNASLAMREPQLAEARASLQSAEAALELAQLDLERTEIRAPFTGRVRSADVDLGEFVRRGDVLAVVFDVESAEVRLPIHDDDLRLIDLEELVRGWGRAEHDLDVVFRASVAGQIRSWTGWLVRAEGELDAQTRMHTVVAKVEDPYGWVAEDGRYPLTPGTFVEASIEGRTVDDLVVVPRAAMRDADHVYVIDQDDRLHTLPVEVFCTRGDDVMLSGGLEAGARVCLSRLDVMADGQQVRAHEERAE